MTCDICKRCEAIGVCSSSLGPMSEAICKLCLQWRAVSLFMVQANYSMCNGTVFPGFYDLITFYKDKHLQVRELPKEVLESYR